MRDRDGGKNTVQEKQLCEYIGRQACCICKLLIIEQLNDQKKAVGDKNEFTMLF